MDGNGRWAERQGLSRAAGHQAGVEAIRRTVTLADELGIEFVSLYSFSTENAGRPEEEVEGLFGLFSRTLGAEVTALHHKQVRIITTGLLDWLPPELAAEFRAAEALTERNEGLTLNLCVMYSGRAELVDAAVGIARAVAEGRLALSDINERSLREYLYRPELPDPELLIRSSGEQRLSNFMLWQVAYSELVFIETLWPDFGEADLLACVNEYQGRERRFGRR
jgi:undecaprenyl diphosphate synthase